MISRLSGVLLEVSPPSVVVDVQGVGYEVDVPTSVLHNLPPTGQPVVLLTHFQVSQDHQSLYGFLTHAERMVFRQLLKISGIGAKLALTILSGASGDQLARFVADGDTASLTRLPGIGKKTAERIIIELRDKLDDLPMATPGSPGARQGSGGGAAAEAADALRALGYKEGEVNRMVRKIAESDMTAEEIIRKALQAAAS
jgi:Holliday junction DNA helicase RuvA